MTKVALLVGRSAAEWYDGCTVEWERWTTVITLLVGSARCDRTAVLVGSWVVLRLRF